MELANIEKLLEAYFEGNTTLAEEATLRSYFTEASVAPHLKEYVPLFSSLQLAKEEVLNKELVLSEETTKTSRNWWYGIAASAAVVAIIAGFVFTQPNLSQEEQEALTAFNESKKAMLLLSQNFNNGTEQLALVGQFSETTNKILK
ncbi:hypothetical protein [Ulvibacter litoralis]|uniref:Uncharacterized protein n=1 Tax=Ulvibacter litoralis TaxID=227084 RepID=A0A1G7F472_9FLAO|nr:hypothetical protein [Ulvibacter litoralis]GHC52738.1 hypothetical protein GCM10008083_15820 [Ulvibacter litoralis]SDE70691.1 hypothetical protein SAMN05421855_102320 [Ulvibacter litoralis]